MKTETERDDMKFALRFYGRENGNGWTGIGIQTKKTVPEELCLLVHRRCADEFGLDLAIGATPRLVVMPDGEEWREFVLISAAGMEPAGEFSDSVRRCMLDENFSEIAPAKRENPVREKRAGSGSETGIPSAAAESPAEPLPAREKRRGSLVARALELLEKKKRR